MLAWYFVNFQASFGEFSPAATIVQGTLVGNRSAKENDPA
jgi:hypothetical protein